MRKSQFWVTLMYVLGILAPYFIPAMNHLSPKLFGMPFPLWWSILCVIIYNIALYVWSRTVWNTYDNENSADGYKVKKEGGGV